MIKAVYKKPNEKPIVIEVENTLAKFQELVSGYIEVIPANKDNSILMIVNEEGLLKGLENNIQYGDSYVVGNVVFVKNGNKGEFDSLADDMAESIIKSLSK